MVDVAGTTAFPKVNLIEGAAVWRTGTVTASGAEIVAANPSRRLGVFVANLDTSTPMLVGDLSSTALFPLSINQNTVNTDPHNQLFIYGQGPVYLKSAIGAAAYICYEI